VSKSAETKKLKEAIEEKIYDAWYAFEEAVEAAEESELTWGYNDWPIYELKDVICDCYEYLSKFSSSKVRRKKAVE